MKRALLFTVALLCACGTGRSEPPPSTAAEGSASHGSEPHEGPREGPAPVVEATPPAPSDPAPAVEVTAASDPYGTVALAVVNRGADSTRLSSRVLLERQDGDRFAAVEDLGTFTLGDELAAEGCVTLAAGAELRAELPCLRAGAAFGCARAPDGRYRFAVRACAGEARTESPAFDYQR